jgi:hypothetical protein
LCLFFWCIFKLFRLYFFALFFSLAHSVTFSDSHHAMKNAPSLNSPSTLTRQAQARILRKHLKAFLTAQAKATAHLQAINAIALCENEGNPLRSALSGTESVAGFAKASGSAEAIDETLHLARCVFDASGYWASA